MTHTYEVFDGAETGNLSIPISTTGTPELETTEVYNSAYSYKMNVSNSTKYMSYETSGFGANGDWDATDVGFAWFSFHLNVTALPGAGQYLYLGLVQRQGGNETSSWRITENGNFEQKIHGGAYTASAETISTGVWYQVSLSARANITGGTSQVVRVADDDTELINDVQNTPNHTNIFRYHIGAWANSYGTMYIDNLIIEGSSADANIDDPYNATGSSYTMRLLTPDATGDEDAAAWGGSHTDIDEIPHDGSTTEELNTTSAGNFLKTMSDVSGFAEIIVAVIGVQSICFVRGFSGSVTGHTRMKIGATTDVTTGRNFNGLSGEPNCKVYQTNPDTAAAWTTAEVNDIQLGFGKTTGTFGLGVTAAYAEIVYSFSPGAVSFIHRTVVIIQ